MGASVLLLVIGLAGLWFGREYEVGIASRMGPGYIPMVLSWGLIFAILNLGHLGKTGKFLVKLGCDEPCV